MDGRWVRWLTGVLLVSMAWLGAGANAQTPTPRTAAPVSPDELVTKKRLAAPKNAKNWTPPRTSWAIPTSRACSRTATRAGFRSSGPQSSKAGSSKTSRRRSSPTWSSSGRSRPSSARRRSASFRARRARCTGSRTTAPRTAARGSSQIRRTAKSRRRRRRRRRVPRRGRPRAARAAPPIPGRIAASTIAASRAACPVDDAGHLRQLVPDSPGPRLRRDPLRDGQRDAHHPARRPPARQLEAFGSYLGDARGHLEGNTLVVETTNFTDKTPYRGSSEHLKLIERFKPHRARHASSGR